MIQIHDTALEDRIRRRIQATGAASPEEALLHLLETQEEQDRWLMESREGINAKIRRGIAQLDRGEGIPEDQLDAFLSAQKSKAE
jgi:hypothetical protein